MKYRVSDLPGLVRTPFGRAQLFDGIWNILWPVFCVTARIYRIVTSRYTSQVAVIGSLGKTTSYRAVASVLGLPTYRKYYRNYKTPVARRILGVPPWQKYGVTEVGIDGPGQMNKFARMIRPAVVIVTSIASEHNRSLKDLETTRFEKSRMLGHLPKDGLAIINGDDPNVLWMKGCTEARVVTYGFGASCDFRAFNYQLNWPRGSSFDVKSPSGVIRVKSKLIGRHMVYPLLAGMTFARNAGMDPEMALSCVENLDPSPGRLEVVTLPGGAFLIRDEFKSTIETVHSALDVLETVPAPSRGIILGDISEPPGSQGLLYRDVGARIAGIVDWAVFCGRKGDAYAAGARKAGMPESKMEKAVHDLAGIAERAVQRLQPGDVVLVKGRDTQRFERISLMMMDRPVKCAIRFCNARTFTCDTCPMLGKGWENSTRLI